MAVQRRKPGTVRDSIHKVMKGKGTMTTSQVLEAVRKDIGEDVAASSVRSHLRLAGGSFEHVDRGRYKLRAGK